MTKNNPKLTASWWNNNIDQPKPPLPFSNLVPISTNLGQERLLKEVENNLNSLTDEHLQELRTTVETEHQRRRERAKGRDAVRTIMYDSNDTPHTLWVHLSPEQKAKRMQEIETQEAEDRQRITDHIEKKATETAEREWREARDRQRISDMR